MVGTIGRCCFPWWVLDTSESKHSGTIAKADKDALCTLHHMCLHIDTPRNGTAHHPFDRPASLRHCKLSIKKYASVTPQAPIIHLQAPVRTVYNVRRSSLQQHRGFLQTLHPLLLPSHLPAILVHLPSHRRRPLGDCYGYRHHFLIYLPVCANIFAVGP